MQRLKTFNLATKAAADSKSGTLYTFRANDGEVDRYQDRVSVSGWKLDAYNANPVVLYQHDEGAGLESGAPILPIGKGLAYVDGDALMVDIQFDQDDEFARKVEAKVAGGFLNAVSVRYVMQDFKQNELGGYDSLAQELLEISVVVVPGNQRALRVKGFDTDAAERMADLVTARVLAALAARDASEDEADVPPESVPLDVAPVEGKQAGGAVIKCGSCDWQQVVPACPECGGEVTAWEAEPSEQPAEESSAAEAAAPETSEPAAEKSPNLEELARELAALTLSQLKEKA
jgi:phage head maturation protease